MEKFSKDFRFWRVQLLFILTGALTTIPAVASEEAEEPFQARGAAAVDFRDGRYEDEKAMLDAKKKANQNARDRCHPFYAIRISNFSISPGYGVWWATAWYECLSQ